MTVLYSKLAKSIQLLEEPILTEKIIIPLILKVHPGKIEYTHSNIEGGRDIVSYGIDCIGRKHILCIQVKAIKISYGASSFGEIKNTAIVAKDTGVALEDGSKVFPNEVWVISSYEFPENKRRQVEDSIAELSRTNIKIISSEELTKLIIDFLPKIATHYSQFSDKNIADYISELSVHKESRAFNLNFDRKINDFFVPATFSTHLPLLPFVLNQAFSFQKEHKQIQIEKSLVDFFDRKKIQNLDKSNQVIIERIQTEYLIVNKSDHSIELSGNILIKSELGDLAKKYNKALEKVKENEGKSEDRFDDSGRKLSKDLNAIKVTININIHFEKTLTAAIKNAKNAITHCPSKLGKNSKPLISAVRLLEQLNSYASWLIQKKYISVYNSPETIKNVLRVQIINPLYILAFNKLILIDGPPGCGKTTFLKILSIKILDSGQKVIFIPCLNILKSYKKKTFLQIVKRFQHSNVPKKWKNKDCILILDGLDEAPFDLSNMILKNESKFKQVIVSTRNIFETSIRNNSFCVGLALLGKAERDLFFKKWFDNDSHYISKMFDLIKTYKDIEQHTRLPLIATITAALVQNNYEPTTKAEIYEKRLDLLLSKWDKFKGVHRIRIDDTKAKCRFLRQLAYNIHSTGQRQRTFTKKDIINAYEQSTGNWGYQNKIEDVINDLVFASGVLVKELNKKYSFGHLSFQEYLAGEYLAKSSVSFHEIRKKLDNDWWYEPLLFYASIKGDISPLLEYIDSSLGMQSFPTFLRHMVKNAPYTAPGAVQVLNAIDEEY
ncbi:MAG: AAA family ATPase [archaeon]|nr:AAA family ATPase [archaeon]